MALMVKFYGADTIKDFEGLFSKIKARLALQGIEAEFLNDGWKAYWIRYKYKKQKSHPKEIEKLISEICDTEMGKLKD